MKKEYLMKLAKEAGIKDCYEKWLDFMGDHVDFWLKDSEVHTKLHCARVMLYALMIGKERNLSKDAMEVLAQAAAFHDSRRQDDWLDTGHGGRAAIYYEAYCKENPQVRYDEITKLIMAFHDRDDAEGIQKIQEKNLTDGVLLYQIFKDADGLDRFRLGENALDVRMLRTREAKELVEFAKNTVDCTNC